MELLTFTDKLCKKCNILFSTASPTVEICLECMFPQEAKVNPLEIVIKPELINTSKLESADAQRLYRPKDFDSYIGQEALKSILKGYIKGCKDLNKTFPHFLVDGKAGTGKTTIAYILAKQLGLNFVECVANSIKSPQQFIDLLVEVNGGILFVDEIHMLNRNVANFILPILEDFQISGKPIKPFTLFSATTEKGSLIKKYKPLVDRFKIQKRLDNYNIEEISTILKIYKDKVFSHIVVNDETINLIAKNSRLTPRIAIRLIESFIFMNKPVKTIFKSYNIVKDGITEDDIKLLNLLKANPKGIGLTTICGFLQTSQENYLYMIESYLIEQGMIAISNKRFITDIGKEFLNGL